MSRHALEYLNNRYHDPTLGVFLSVDPLVTTTGEPYIYASGNPTTLSDPSGLCSMVAGDFYCGNINFGNVASGDYDSNLHNTQYTYEFRNQMLDTVDIDRPECGNGCNFTTGVILGMVSTLGAPLLAYSSAMNDPVGTVTDAADPRTYVEAARGCVSSAEGAGTCVGSALMAGAISKGLCVKVCSADRVERLSGPTSPFIDPRSVAGLSPGELDSLARSRGLIPKGPDPAAGRGAYVDPVTGQQRIPCHPDGCGGGHIHVNDPSGQRLDIGGRSVPPESPAAHLPGRFS